MDSLSSFTAPNAPPGKASLLDRLGMPETLRGGIIPASAPPPSASRAPKPSPKSSLLQRMQLSGNSTLLKDSDPSDSDRETWTSAAHGETGSATGCSPTVQSVTRPMRRKKRRLSQAAAAASSGAAVGTDLKPSLLRRLEGDVDGAEEEVVSMLKIKGSAAAEAASDATPIVSSAGFRHIQGRGHQTLMHRMGLKEGKERA